MSQEDTRRKKIFKKKNNDGLRQLTIMEAFGLNRVVDLEIDEYSKWLGDEDWSEMDMSLPDEIKTPEFIT